LQVICFEIGVVPTPYHLVENMVNLISYYQGVHGVYERICGQQVLYIIRI